MKLVEKDQVGSGYKRSGEGDGSPRQSSGVGIKRRIHVGDGIARNCGEQRRRSSQGQL